MPRKTQHLFVPTLVVSDAIRLSSFDLPDLAALKASLADKKAAFARVASLFALLYEASALLKADCTALNSLRVASRRLLAASAETCASAIACCSGMIVDALVAVGAANATSGVMATLNGPPANANATARDTVAFFSVSIDSLSLEAPKAWRRGDCGA
jgi:hypothetical protein